MGSVTSFIFAPWILTSVYLFIYFIGSNKRKENVLVKLKSGVVTRNCVEWNQFGFLWYSNACVGVEEASHLARPVCYRATPATRACRAAGLSLRGWVWGWVKSKCTCLRMSKKPIDRRKWQMLENGWKKPHKSTVLSLNIPLTDIPCTSCLENH